MNSLLLLALLAAPGQSSPLHCDRPEVDRGEVRGGPPLTQRYTLSNCGRSDLAITEVRPSCGCLAPKLSTRLLKPGESATLDIGVGTVSQPDGLNLWSVKLTARSGDADFPLELRLKATLNREVKLEPSAVRLFGAPGLAHEITLTDRRDKPFDVTAVRTSSAHIAADAGAWRRDGECWVRKIRVQLTADCPDGRSDEIVTIYSSDPDYRALAVPVTATRRDRQRYLVTPAEVKLDVRPGQPTPSVLVLIRDHEGRPVEVGHVESDDPALVCRFADGPNPTAAVRIQVRKDQTPAAASKLTIQILAPVADSISIPVKK